MRAIALGGLLAGVAMIGCHANEADPIRDKAEGAPVPVAVLTIRQTNEPETVRLVAVVEPNRRTAVGSRLMARVVEVRADEGDRVPRGAVLVQLDTRDLSARQRQVAASATAADAQAQLASSELARTKRLAATGALPGVQVESAETSATASGAAVDGAHAALAEVAVQLGESTIRAPFDALVVQKRTEVGSFSAPGQPLLVLEDDSVLRVLAPMADRYAGAVRAGAAYPVAFATGDEASGVLESVTPSGDPRSPGLVAILRVRNERHALRAGVVAYVTVPTGEARRSAVLRVPSRALVRRGGLAGVFVVRDSRLHLVWCAIDDTAGDGTIRVLDGLVDGDVVVSDAAAPGLRDGMLVSVRS